MLQIVESWITIDTQLFQTCNICMCDVIEKFKTDQETMALVNNQHQSSSKMRSVFVDCQSGHHSHASLIKTLTKVYNNVSSEVSLALFISSHVCLQLKTFLTRLCGYAGKN